MYVDVHCHLNHKLLMDQIDDVIQRAREHGVTKIICAGVNVTANREVLVLAEKYDIVEAALGMYPIDSLGLSEGESGLARQIEPIDYDSEFKFIKKNQDKIVAIGEVGMDFHWDKKYHDKQKENFARVIKLGEKLRKPLVIHSRKAEKECIEMLESSKLKHVVMHCFTGKKSLIKKAVDLGFYFSIPCIVQKAQIVQIVAELNPLSRLLTETDAPWLGPIPGVPNEPMNVVASVKKIAEIKGLEEIEVKGAIWKNYQTVFG